MQPAPHMVGFDSALFPRVHHDTGQTIIETTGLGEVVEGFSIDFEAECVGAFFEAEGRSVRLALNSCWTFDY